MKAWRIVGEETAIMKKMAKRNRNKRQAKSRHGSEAAKKSVKIAVTAKIS
jgi:hypothetical protein